MGDNGFDVNKVLHKPVFTVPVTLRDRDDSGTEVDREILIQYQFDDELQDEINAGILDEKATAETIEKARALVGDADAIPVPKPVTRDFTISEQLAKIVKTVKGVNEPLDINYWRGVPGKHKQSIITAINADINPQKTPSAA